MVVAFVVNDAALKFKEKCSERSGRVRAGRKSAQHVPDCWRRVRVGPLDNLGTSRVILCGQGGSSRGVCGSTEGVGCHVRHRCCVPCGSGCSNGWRVGDVARGRVGSGGERAHRAYPQLAAGEGTDAVEGFARTRVSRGLSLEQG